MADRTAAAASESLNQQQNSHLYSVGEICSMCSITRKTLFYYDQIGLLKPSKRIGTQKFKYYDAAQLNRLQQILKYRTAGLMISEIKQLLASSGVQRLEILENAMSRLQTEKQQTESEIVLLGALIDQEKENHQAGSSI